MQIHEFPRLHELRKLLPELLPQDAYFRGFETSVETCPAARKWFSDLERDLARLDSEAWESLKVKAKPYLTKRDKARGWQQLYDILNEAKAYIFLMDNDFLEVEFIPESKIKGKKTPDFKAYKNCTRVYLEAKTINFSNIEIARFNNNEIFRITPNLSNEFMKKVSSDIELSTNQINNYATETKFMKIIFINVNFDDRLNDGAEKYGHQIEKFLASSCYNDSEIVVVSRNSTLALHKPSNQQ
ncbi:hypothetical protein LXM94_17055 [Rhizobium sp. TRM95111]|uniref:hypothetical protein n=1 Tax=Rhizobium alarense TaxID=2846851 RepID=UPI001F44C8D3|nr:hypothetical protein [Rhizobium alarense]MCF3641683.1 hypothetical protein [Rhizobium alarense]